MSIEYDRQTRVFCVDVPEATYDYRLIREAVGRLLGHAGLDKPRAGTPNWNPLSDVIRRGDCVLIKPNWVRHSTSPAVGPEVLMTHTCLIDAVMEHVVRAEPARVIVADAPVQGCDFAQLKRQSGIDSVVAKYGSPGMEILVRDLRLVLSTDERLQIQTANSGRCTDDYILFDLATSSELEPISEKADMFRVTMYDPKALGRTHQHGRHHYLIAREAIDADVVINLPKLKAHKKAGITCALKNMVGVNGHKAYLPHHRKGGSATGGDCYPGRHWTKRLAEDMLDLANSLTHPRVRRFMRRAAARVLSVGNKLHGCGTDVEGSWYGNDTVWRTCLDIQRILHYGRADGTMGRDIQRRIVTITDAVIAGEGEGPLSPSPVPLGMLTLAFNVAAADWVHAHLMRFDPNRIPLATQAFDSGDYPLTDFQPHDIVADLNGTTMSPAELADRCGRSFRPPAGWTGHCELSPLSSQTGL